VTQREILLGNEAIAHGLIEAGCTLAASYPGTPASEIMSTLIHLKKKQNLKLHLEWSINEKVAFEVALTNSFAGRRSAVMMKQVGLNVAADSLMSAAYTGVKGGFVIVSADDPGPHSSQTEQDSRFFAMMAKIPVLDPSSPEEARDMMPLAFALSEAYELPVMVRPTTRVCHARQDIAVREISPVEQAPRFEREPGRWAATPKFRLILHRQLNDKIASISQSRDYHPVAVNPTALGSVSSNKANHAPSRDCIVSSGAVLTYAQELLLDLGLWDKVPIYKTPLPYPLPEAFRDSIIESYDRILVLEESYPVIELQLQNRVKVFGRTTGTIPNAGELLPEVVEDILRSFFGMPESSRPAPPQAPGRRPTLCAGCPHRAAFFAIKKAFPKGIYPGDIGCYTLGMNLGAVDSFLCMGASVSQAAGFYHAYSTRKQDAPPIAATIGDSTFFHSGIPALINAVVQDARFVLVILDNSTTAMTGHQPTPAEGLTLDGTVVPKISIPKLVEACGVRYVVEEDPYQMDAFVNLLKEAGKHSRAPEGGVAVVISKRPCLMDRRHSGAPTAQRVRVNEKCQGCGFCVKHFECPALQLQKEKEPVRIDPVLCAECGVCVYVCPHKALELE
jgi:indolepyruvate ferredoxin oxidoreductase alpha subunit